ncbi:MAG: hypothetical protein ABSH33_20710, partial [Steroidobacteraceae bacterium]
MSIFPVNLGYVNMPAMVTDPEIRAITARSIFPDSLSSSQIRDRIQISRGSTGPSVRRFAQSASVQQLRWAALTQFVAKARGVPRNPYARRAFVGTRQIAWPSERSISLVAN